MDAQGRLTGHHMKLFVQNAAQRTRRLCLGVPVVDEIQIVFFRCFRGRVTGPLHHVLGDATDEDLYNVVGQC